MIDSNDIEAKLRALGKRETPRKRVLPTKLLAAIAIIAWIPAIYAIDEHLFPVVSRSAVIFGQPLADGKTRVQFLYTKNRDCRFVGMRFMLTGPTVKILDFDRGTPVSRPIGRQLSRVFVVDVPQNEFIERGVVTVQHRCHWFWTHDGRLF